MPIGEDNIMVTIIIYAYNAEERLEQCVESVLSQTYTDFEIIIVDDGSSDMTAIKALQMADEDDRIQVYGLIKRIGPANAKNNGIYNASGNYILFLDSTDCLEQNALQIMVSTAKSHDADLVIGNFKYCPKNQVDIIDESCILNHKVYSKEEAINCIHIPGICGNKLWKSSLIGKYDIKFQDKCLGEDMVFFHYGLARCTKIVTITDFVLEYRIPEKNDAIYTWQDAVREPFDLIRINYQKTGKPEYAENVMYNELIYRINGIKNIPLYKNRKFRKFLFDVLSREMPEIKSQNDSVNQLAAEYKKIRKKRFLYTSSISTLAYRHIKEIQKKITKKEKGDVYFGKYYNPGV